MPSEGEGFGRTAAAQSANGDRCPQRIQCRDSRSRGRARCCASRFNVSSCVRSRHALLFSPHRDTAPCAWVLARSCRGFSRVSVLSAAATAVAVAAAEAHESPERWVPSFAQTPLSGRLCSEVRALSSRAAARRGRWTRSRFPAGLSFSLRDDLCRSCDKSRAELVDTWMASFDPTFRLLWDSDNGHVGTRFSIFPSFYPCPSNFRFGFADMI